MLHGTVLHEHDTIRTTHDGIHFLLDEQYADEGGGGYGLRAWWSPAAASGRSSTSPNCRTST